VSGGPLPFGAFMEQAAAFHLITGMEQPVQPEIINSPLDYLRPVHLGEACARCLLTRQGHMIADVAITTWQEDRDKPDATARAHFLPPDNN